MDSILGWAIGVSSDLLLMLRLLTFGHGGLRTHGAVVWGDMKDRIGIDPQSTPGSDRLLKIACYCTGELLEEYDRKASEIKALLADICDNCLLEKESRICFRVPDTGREVKFPRSHKEFLQLDLHGNEMNFSSFHNHTRYKNGRADDAYKKLDQVRKLVKSTMVVCGGSLRLLLDRMAMRALFKRALDDAYELLNTSAHPSEKVIEDPEFSQALIWLSRWPGPIPGQPDTTFRRLHAYDESILTYYARPLTASTIATHVMDYVEVSCNCVI